MTDEPAAKRRSGPLRRWAGAAVALLLLSTTLLGAWLTSSLAAYWNAPAWVPAAVVAAVLLALPLGWELRAALRRRQTQGRAWFSWSTRLGLRAFAINLLLCGVCLGAVPRTTFEALSTRGDWPLDEATGPTAETGRAVAFFLADRVEWAYGLATENRFARDVEPTPGPRPVPQPPPAPRPLPPDDGSEPDPDLDDGAPPDGDPVDIGSDPETEPPVPEAPRFVWASGVGWPQEPRLHPVVAEMHGGVEHSIRDVAEYIAARETDPVRRVKALHDWVADRIAYDAEGLAAGDYGAQDAQAVFEKRTAVCAGYSNLLVVLGSHTGDEIVQVVGHARDETGGIGGVGHAWNAVKLDGQWYLVDATWDAGTVEGEVFQKRYRTTYLFAPPEVFGMTHLPGDEAWQLRERPISRGEFLRQPMLRAEFFAAGLELLEPTRSRTAVDRVARVRLDNPFRRTVLASLAPHGRGGRGGRDCEVRGRESVEVSCEVPPDGVWEVRLYSGLPGRRSYPYVGHLEVTAGG